MIGTRVYWLGLLGVLVGCSSPDPGNPGGGGGGVGGGGTGGSGGAGGVAPTGQIVGPVTRYDYAFDATTGIGTVGLTVDVAAPGGDCALFASELGPSGESAWNGAPATSAALENGTSLRVCGAPVFPGDLAISVPVAVPEKTFFGLDVGYSKIKNHDGGDFTYMLTWVSGCDHLGPCDESPGTLAEIHHTITHPPGATVLCAGTLTPGDTETKCDVSGTLAPTYSGVGFSFDPMWQKSPFMTAGGVDLVFYETPSGTLAASLVPAVVDSFFTWIQDRFGEYPYGKELRLAGGPTAWLGFEHPGNIVFQEGLDTIPTSYADTMMHVFMHEVTHQWAGDRTTIAESRDFVWKEAIAEYVPYVFERNEMGQTISGFTREYWDGISIGSQHFPRPTDEPAPPVHLFYGDVYGPGPMVLFVQLEPLLGEGTVLKGIEQFLSAPGARSVADLQSALENASGKDLDAYFDAWVFGAGKPEWPTFEIAVDQPGGPGTDVTVTATQVNASGKLYPCVVEIEVSGDMDSQVVSLDFGLAPESASVTAVVSFNGGVVGHALDPDHKLIAREKVANLKDPPPPKVWIF